MKRRSPLTRSPLPSGGRPLRRKTPMVRGDAQLKQTPINRVSKKRARENRERKAMVRQLWPDMQPACIVKDCGRLADDVHEPLSRGRGGSITDPANAVPICRPCHDALTFGEPAWAYEQGLKFHSWDKRVAS